MWPGGSWTSIGDFRMEDFMLEDYYVKPSTLDRVRASWLAPQIEGCLASAGVVIAPRSTMKQIYRSK
jgi:hypothetical protein